MREQIQRLDGRPGTEVQSGVSTTGVIQTSAMPFVQPKQSKGERLAKSLGMAVDAGMKIGSKVVELYEGQLDEEAVNQFHQDKFTMLEELNSLNSNADKQLWFQNKMKEFSSPDVNTKYRDAFVNSFSGAYNSVLEGVKKESNKFQQSQLYTKIQNNVADGELRYAETTKDFNSVLNKNLYHEPVANAIADQLALEAAALQSQDIVTQKDIKAFETKADRIIKQYKDIPYAGGSTSAEAVDIQTKLYTKIATIKKSLNTKKNEIFKDKLDYLKATNTDPVVIEKHLKEGLNTGAINQIEYATETIKWNESWTKNQLSTQVKSLTETEKNIVAGLKNDESSYYLSNEENKVYSRYSTVIDNLVKLESLTVKEGDAKKKAILKEIEDNRELADVKSNFSVKDTNNVILAESTNTKVSKFVKDNVTNYVLDNNNSLNDRVEAALTIPSIGKLLATTNVPFTTDSTAFIKGQQFINDLKTVPNGQHLYNNLPRKTRLLYNTVETVIANGLVAETELPTFLQQVNEKIANIENLDDYGVKIKDKVKVNEKLAQAMSFMPDSVQQEIAITYDFLTNISGIGAKEAAVKVANDIVPNYMTTIKDGGKAGLFEGSPNKTRFINFSKTPFASYLTTTSKSDALIDSIMTLTAIPYSNKNINIVYDDNTETMTVTQATSKGFTYRTVTKKELEKALKGK